VLPLGESKDRYLDLNFEHPRENNIKPSTLDISVDGTPWKSIIFNNLAENLILSIPITELSSKNGFISISIKKSENQDLTGLRLAFAKFR
jgi:hypothetical protein